MPYHPLPETFDYQCFSPEATTRTQSDMGMIEECYVESVARSRIFAQLLFLLNHSRAIVSQEKQEKNNMKKMNESNLRYNVIVV
jgi:hypothetical protein